jgi:hypothetical protein
VARVETVERWWDAVPDGRLPESQYPLCRLPRRRDAVDPNDPDCWYVSANPGPRLAHYGEQSAEAYIYRWRGHGPWKLLGGGLPQPLDRFPYALAVGPNSLFAGLGDGRIYRSEDRGEHWKLLDIAGDPPTCVLALILT